MTNIREFGHHFQDPLRPLEEECRYADLVRTTWREGIATRTELLAPRNLDDGRTIRIQHIVQALYMREAVLDLEARLQRRHRAREAHDIVVQHTYAMQRGDEALR
jgi:hypothetical protein